MEILPFHQAIIVMNKSVLLFGGNSGERLVSTASAQNLAQNFEFDEIVYIHTDGKLSQISKTELLAHANAFQNQFATKIPPFAKSLSEGVAFFKNKNVFLALHGTEGEDGQLQALFEKNKIMFTGSGAEASHNAFLKDTSKEIVRKLGLTLAPEMVVEKNPSSNDKEKLFNFFEQHKKIVLKPVASGSSIGLYIVNSRADLDHALASMAKAEFTTYLAEKFLKGRELTVAVIDSEKGLQALAPSEVIMIPGRNFDYEGKYLGHGTTEVTPAKLEPGEIERAQELAIAAHKAFSCYGYSRTDMILVDSHPIFMETNTLPGLSKASFVPQQLACYKIAIKDFVVRQLELAQKRYN